MDVYSSGEWHVKAGREDEFVQAWRDLAEASGQEFEANTWSFLLRDRQDPRHFRSLALWSDEQAAAAWRQGEMFRQRTSVLAAMVEKVEIDLFESVVTVGSVPETMTPAAGRY